MGQHGSGSGLTSRWRGLLAAAAGVTVSVSLLTAPPVAWAAVEDRSSWTEEQRRAHGQRLWPDRSDADPARQVRTLAAPPLSAAEPAPPAPMRPVLWPQTGQVVVQAPPVDGPALRKRPIGAAAPGGLPVWMRELTGRTGTADAPAARVRVEVTDRATTSAAHVDGVLLRVEPVSSVTTPVELRLDYSGFAHAYGGDWASRLGLVALPDCALTDPADPGCLTGAPVESVNDIESGTVTATLDAGSLGVLALTAGASGPAGDWSATSLSASAAWQVSPHTGDFSWSYPLRTPPAVGGPAPDLAVGYSSGSVDGRVASTNNQTSWVGDGWDLWSGYVERKYAACADDDTAGANNIGHETGDLCWKTDNATLVFGGRASELVKDTATGKWKLRNDDGSRVERLTGGTNADNDTEYWKLTTTDGTQYFFGIGKRYGSDTDRTNATWTVPVFGNHPGEPCYQSSFAAAHCVQGGGGTWTMWWTPAGTPLPTTTRRRPTTTAAT